MRMTTNTMVIRPVKSFLLLYLFAFLPFFGFAQDFRIIKGDCTPEPSGTEEALARSSAAIRRLPSINNKWDPTRTYKQLVILIEFNGDSTYFSMEHPREFYDSVFNMKGFNKMDGKGCVADYFRDQSSGQFNLEFDVYGPYRIEQKGQPYDSPTDNIRNYGREAMIAATRQFLTENPEMDYQQYDWNGNNAINQVIYIFAGYSGNQGSQKVYGYLWPNTSSFATIQAPGGLSISNYTCSAEKFSNGRLCGLGTICHEFTHSLGLPDIYPVANEAGYSVCDEWDLMDGGNFTNYGWCPPNFTSLEKWLLGWLSFTELDEPATITDMKSVEDEGEIYRIKHSDSEWLLLENRQQRGWDAGVPGKGLVIFHVYYDASVWRGNTVNNNPDKRRFELVHADGIDYDQWAFLLVERGVTSQSAVYQNPSNRMNSWLLSGSPYPWTNDSASFVNNSLTVTSVPAPRMNYPDVHGDTILNKPITNIQMSEDGLISFDFMGGDKTAVNAVKEMKSSQPVLLFDLSGRQVSRSGKRGLYLRRDKNGVIKKIL